MKTSLFAKSAAEAVAASALHQSQAIAESEAAAQAVASSEAAAFVAQSEAAATEAVAQPSETLFQKADSLRSSAQTGLIRN